MDAEPTRRSSARVGSWARWCVVALRLAGPFAVAAVASAVSMDEPLVPAATRSEEPPPPADAKPAAHPASSGDIFGDTFEVTDG